jgi:hypothetical protein
MNRRSNIKVSGIIESLPNDVQVAPEHILVLSQPQHELHPQTASQ